MEKRADEWEYMVKGSILGVARLHIRAMEQHSHQRSIDRTLVQRLVEDINGKFNREQSQIHVVPKDPLPIFWIERLRLGGVVENFPDDIKFQVIDGQHRYLALVKIQESGWIVDHEDFFRWPAVVHSWGEYKTGSH